MTIQVHYNGALYLARDLNISNQHLGDGKTEKEALEDMVGISEGGRSFSQWSECIPGRHLGKVIAWDELSKETQQHIITKINTE